MHTKQTCVAAVCGYSASHARRERCEAVDEPVSRGRQRGARVGHAHRCGGPGAGGLTAGGGRAGQGIAWERWLGCVYWQGTDRHCS